MILKKIISGGQTGTDQAALQAAIDSGLDHGGWCPPGRTCESGQIPECFNLRETPEETDPTAPDIPRSQRTIWNVRDSEASLVFWVGEMTDLLKDSGTKLALDTAKQLGKPYLVVDPSEPDLRTNIEGWLEEHQVEVLSVGGPSEGDSPGIFGRVHRLLTEIFSN